MGRRMRHLDIQALRMVVWVFCKCHHDLSLKQSAWGIGGPTWSQGPVCLFMLVTPTAAGSALEAQFLREVLPANTLPHLVAGETTEWVVFCGGRVVLVPMLGKPRESGAGGSHPGPLLTVVSGSLTSQLGTCSTIIVPLPLRASSWRLL